MRSRWREQTEDYFKLKRAETPYHVGNVHFFNSQIFRMLTQSLLQDKPKPLHEASARPEERPQSLRALQRKHEMEKPMALPFALSVMRNMEPYNSTQFLPSEMQVAFS